MEIIFSGTIANFSDFKNEKFLEMIVSKINDVELYQYKPRPGVIQNASKDWKAIGNISSLLGIVSFAWQVYSEFIEPKKIQDSNSGIILRIEHMGHHNNFWIGHDIRSEEQLMQRVVSAVEELKNNSQNTQKEVDSLRKSILWYRVNSDSLSDKEK